MNTRRTSNSSGAWGAKNAWLALCLWGLLLPAHSQNLIKNGDFEEPLGPDNWTVAYTNVLNSGVANPPSGCGPEDFMVQDRTTLAHRDRVTGVWDGNYLGANFRPNSDWLMHAYFKQTVTNLIPGSNYIVTAWMA